MLAGEGGPLVDSLEPGHDRVRGRSLHALLLAAQRDHVRRGSRCAFGRVPRAGSPGVRDVALEIQARVQRVGRRLGLRRLPETVPLQAALPVRPRRKVMRSPVIFEPCSVITVQHALADLDDGPGALAAPHWMDPLLISWASLQVARRPWRSTTEQTKGLRSTMKISRSEFLKLGLMGGTALVLPFGTPGCTSVGQNLTGRLLRSEARLPEPFRVPLPVPPVLRPAHSNAQADYYEITQKVGKAEILPGLETEVWGYEGIFPGPTIESRSGRKIVVRQINDLPVPVSTHLHGGRTPPGSDGYPTDLIMPNKEDHAMGGHGSMDMGASRHFKDYTYPLEQRAATLWYHDHRMDFTGPQVWRGLAGFHIIRDEEDDDLPLPGGEKDVPLMICDRSFDNDGSFLYPSLDPSLQGEPGVEDDYMDGVLGDTILVNGAPWPVMEVSNTKYRFRILNASNARRYELALEPSNRAPFVRSAVT